MASSPFSNLMTSEKPLVLATNDDGIDSEFLVPRERIGQELKS